jgi:hypothetical protein
MFATFPSFQPSATRLSETVQSFLDDLEPYSDGIVSRACRAIRQQARQFPPGCGEIIAVCEKLSPRSVAGVPVARKLRPLDKLPDAEREASKARVQQLFDNLMRDLAAQRIDESAPFESQARARR